MKLIVTRDGWYSVNGEITYLHQGDEVEPNSIVGELGEQTMTTDEPQKGGRP